MYKSQSGFTLLEIMVAFSIMALLMGLTMPAASKMYDSMKYRDAVRSIVTAIHSTRYAAITTGLAVDFAINPGKRQFRVGQGKEQVLGAEISLAATTAREVNYGGNAVIRFYPDGSATGGSIDVRHEGGKAVRVRVGWLLGKLTQETYEQ